MFCDLVGSTALSQQLDPEEYQEWLEAYRAACSRIVGQHEGAVARMVGDGLLIYFGYPVAHEDDPQRAVRAGLGILDAMRELSGRFRERFSAELGIRIGVHTGLVVVGDIGEGDTLEPMGTVGETPNIAARIQASAVPNELIISDATHQLTRGYFATESLGERHFKGVAEPIEVHRVDAESGVTSRLEIALGVGLTPLVGRQEELDTLAASWRRTVAGAGQVVLVSGEAGIGKSRLIRALQERLSGTAHNTFQGFCFPHFKHTALFPIVDLFKRGMRFRASDAPSTQLNKLLSGVARHLTDPDGVPLLASMLSIPRVGDSRHQELSPDMRRRKLLATILEFFEGLSRETPVLLIIEDLHWIDPSSIDLLTQLIDHCARLRIMLVLTFRNAFVPPWERKEHLSHLALDRLSAGEALEMVHNVTMGKSLPRELLDQVIATTDGVPLFLEEVTKMELESGMLVELEDAYEIKGSFRAAFTIPPTLRDSLLARLDLLAGGKVVAQLGATLGREFTFDLLAAISPLPEAELKRALDQLVDAQLLLKDDRPDAPYVFKHALIQEVAYDSVLRRVRRQYHRRIAEHLAASAPEVTRTHPEVLAHHYTEAGFAEEGIRHWKLAGARAVEYSAHIEASRHFKKGLDLVGALETASQKREELELLVALGVPLTATKGYAHGDAEQLYLRTQELSEQLQDTVQLFRSHSGLYRCYITRGRLKRALTHGERLLEVSKSSGDPVYMTESERAIGATLLALGRLAESRAHLENGLATYDFEKYSGRTFETASDPGLSCMLWLLFPLWLMGFPDDAVRRSDEALRLAKKRGQAYEVAFALLFHAWLYIYRREWNLVVERADACIEISREHGFPLWIGAGEAFRGKALVELGNRERGMPLLEQGVALFKRTGAAISLPLMLFLQAECCAGSGEVDKALAIVEEAFDVVDEHDEHVWEAELHRLKGELLSLQGKTAEDVLREYQAALDLARNQGAKSLELRAAMSKARFLYSQSDAAAARAELGEIHRWFGQGLDTPDLREARALARTLE